MPINHKRQIGRVINSEEEEGLGSERSPKRTLKITVRAYVF